MAVTAIEASSSAHSSSSPSSQVLLPISASSLLSLLLIGDLVGLLVGEVVSPGDVDARFARAPVEALGGESLEGLRLDAGAGILEGLGELFEGLPFDGLDDGV